MTEPASIRFKNPGAMWGSALAIKWGAAAKAVTLNDGKGQGNNIAVFQTFVQGICAQLDLWRTSGHYRNKRFADAIAVWSGGNEVGSYIAFVLKRVPGMTRNTIMNDAFWRSPTGIAFLKAQAWHEAGKPYPAPDADWIEAQRRVFVGDLPAPQEQTEPVKSVVRCYCMYGLGGRIWSGGMEDLVAANLRKIPGVHVDPTRGFMQWREIVDDIKKHPGDKFVVIGHSMGAASATYATDYVHVNLVVCYDCAGQKPSGIAKNCNRLLDFQDIGFDINPNYRPWAYPGHEAKIERIVTRDGHIYQDDDQDLSARVVAEVRKLGT